MEREPRVLQERIEAGTFDRRRIYAQEWIRGEENVDEKCRSEEALNSECRRRKRRAAAFAERGENRIDREHQHPEEHRAFVVSPHARDFVEEGFQRVRILRHVEDAEIRRDEAGDERPEREVNENREAECRARRNVPRDGRAFQPSDQPCSRLHK